MNKKYLLGFVQLPVIIAIAAALLGIGGLVASKVPEIRREASYKELSKNRIPSGTARENELLVGFKTSLSLPQIAKIHQAQEATHKKRLSGINVDVVSIPAQIPLTEARKKYESATGVEFAEPNFLAQAFYNPDDPLINKQWGLKKINSLQAFDHSKGGFYSIAIIDTGVDSNHAELSPLLLDGYNTIDNNEATDDDHGHGTHVAGIAAAQTDNGTGVASSSFYSQILPVKVLNQVGVGTYADVAEGIIFSADEGSRILNLSLGGNSDSQTLERAVEYAKEKGSILVAAAGNNGNDAPVYPAAYTGVLAVSASDENDELASFSSFGSNIFVAAPGVSITSTDLGDSYTSKHGTSMSAPHLSGTLGLLLAKEEDLTNTQLLSLVKESADKVGSESYNEDGWNAYFGYGRLNAGEALANISETEEDLEETETATSESDSATAIDSSTDSRERSEVPERYSFSFELQGETKSTDTKENSFTVSLRGGTPHVLNVVSGDLVTIYTDENTRIKYQGQEISLEELVEGTDVNVKGNIELNKLWALEIIVQSELREEPAEEAPTEKPEMDEQQTPSSLEFLEGTQENTGTENSEDLPKETEPRIPFGEEGSVQGEKTFQENILMKIIQFSKQLIGLY